MAFIEWNGSLEVKVAKIDEQHQGLVRILNDLHEAMQVGRGKQILDDIFTGLINYTVTHFAMEESLMQQNNYPLYPVHKKEHVILTQQALDLQTRFKDGKTTVTIEVMRFLGEWLNKHILDSDKKLGKFLNEKGIH